MDGKPDEEDPPRGDAAGAEEPPVEGQPEPPPEADGEDDATPPSPWLRGRRAWLWRVPLLWLALTLVLVLPLRWLRPPTTAFMLLYGGPEAREAWEWVDLDDVSPEVAIAVVASEDQRFPVHPGIDVEAIRKAMSEDRGRVRGASTISQQVAKNLYLWAGRSWIRKGLEVWFTVSIEALWPKRRVLEMYLNVAQFGPTTFGIGAASREFFGKDPATLDRYQASLLAVVLPSPSRMRPDRPSAYMQQRALWVREQVQMLGGPRYLDRLR